MDQAAVSQLEKDALKVQIALLKTQETMGREKLSDSITK